MLAKGDNKTGDSQRDMSIEGGMKVSDNWRDMPVRLQDRQRCVNKKHGWIEV